MRHGTVTRAEIMASPGHRLDAEHWLPREPYSYQGTSSTWPFASGSVRYYGLVYAGKGYGNDMVGCGHKHRSRLAAEKCGIALAKRSNRIANQP